MWHHQEAIREPTVTLYCPLSHLFQKMILLDSEKIAPCLLSTTGNFLVSTMARILEKQEIKMTVQCLFFYFSSKNYFIQEKYVHQEIACLASLHHQNFQGCYSWTFCVTFQEYVQSLPKELLEDLIVELAASGNGSLDHLQDLVHVIQDSSDDVQQSTPALIHWCKCGVCTIMPSAEERKCCGKKQCVTSFHTFRKVCLDRDILEVCAKTQADHFAEDFEFSTSSFRKAAYRQFVMWKYGKLGYGNRRIIPSCAVTMIRAAYPSPDGTYMGFCYN